jgi:hypothetical protein
LDWIVFYVVYFLWLTRTTCVQECHLFNCPPYPGEEFFWIVFYVVYFLCLARTTCVQECCLIHCPPGRGVFLDCILCCMFFGGPYQVCSEMSSAQLSSRSRRFGLYSLYCICSLGVFTTRAQECRLLKSPPGRGFFLDGIQCCLFSLVGPYNVCLGYVVCSTVHPGEELFGLYSISYMFYDVLTTCVQECRLLHCPARRGDTRVPGVLQGEERELLLKRFFLKRLYPDIRVAE